MRTALEFLKSRASAAPFGSGLNRLPFVLFDAVAAVMEEYAKATRNALPVLPLGEEKLRECAEGFCVAPDGCDDAKACDKQERCDGD